MEREQLWRLAFGDPEDFIQGFFQRVYTPDHSRVIRMDGRLAAALYWLDGESRGRKIAYLYAVATHPDFRGRGLCRELMEDTHRELADRGYAGAMLLPAGDGLRRMYRSMGYRDAVTIAEFPARAGAPIPIRRLDRESYAALRRRYLPEGGVIQEGKNLELLELTAALYAGEDFLLAAYPQGETLRGVELLGDPAAAPGILAALGFPRGTFRTPGTGRSWAMFHPLAEGAQAPDYFGLAFDD